jgi:hypothetical protein
MAGFIIGATYIMAILINSDIWNSRGDLSVPKEVIVMFS